MKPVRMVSVINQLGLFRTGDPDRDMARGIEVDAVVREAREWAQRYRAVVLGHADLRDRLQHLFALQRPESWNGHVPPRTDGYGAYNSSPYRAGLVEIVSEALTRNQAWQPADADRLATVPARHIKAPWAEPRRGHTTAPGGQGLWPEG